MWLISEYKPFVVFFIDTLCCWVCWVGVCEKATVNSQKYHRANWWTTVVGVCGFVADCNTHFAHAMAIWCRLFCIWCSRNFAISTLVPSHFAGCVTTQQIIHSHFLYFGIFHSHFPSRSALHNVQICITKFTEVQLWVKNCDVFQS